MVQAFDEDPRLTGSDAQSEWGDLLLRSQFSEYSETSVLNDADTIVDNETRFMEWFEKRTVEEVRFLQDALQRQISIHKIRIENLHRSVLYMREQLDGISGLSNQKSSGTIQMNAVDAYRGGERSDGHP